MGDLEHIQSACERNVQLLRRRPALGQKTYVTSIRVRNGLTCDIEDGPWTLTADLAPKAGGNGAGPTPGTFGRAALGSCLAMSYVMWAARLGVSLSDMTIEVQADTDVRGMYGIDDVPAGYTAIRYHVSITSPAAAIDVLRVLDIAERHSPYVEVFRRSQTLYRHVRLTARGEELTL